MFCFLFVFFFLNPVWRHKTARWQHFILEFFIDFKSILNCAFRHFYLPLRGAWSTFDFLKNYFRRFISHERLFRRMFCYFSRARCVYIRCALTYEPSRLHFHRKKYSALTWAYRTHSLIKWVPLKICDESVLSIWIKCEKEEKPSADADDVGRQWKNGERCFC